MRKFVLLSFLGIVSTVLNVQILFAAPYAYITNYGSNDLTIIETNTGSVVATIPVGVNPQGIVGNMNKTRVYIANSGSDTVSVVDTVSNRVTNTIPVGDYPIGLAMQIDGSCIFVTNGGDDTLQVINTANYTTSKTVRVGDSPVGVAVTPDGTKAYVVNFESNNVSVIDLLTYSVIHTIPVGHHPQVVFIDSRGEKAYVTNSGGNSVSVISISTNSVIATVPVGHAPQCLAMSLDGTRVYATNFYDNNVSVIDAANNTEIFTIPVGKGPQGIAVDLSDKIYVANFNSDNVSVINNITYTVEATLPAGKYPMAFGQFVSGNPTMGECTCVVSPCPPPPPGCTGTGGLNLRINQIDTSLCPTIQAYFTINDLQGEPISGVQESDLQLLEDSVSCPFIDVIRVNDVLAPASIVVTMDYSGSMYGQPLLESQNAAFQFVQGMNTPDAAEVIKFSGSYDVVQPFTTDKTLLKTVVTSAWSGGGGMTSMYDAVYQAVTNAAMRASRRAVIVMTDGRDNTSARSLDSVIAHAQNDNVPVFTVGLGNAIELALKRLANETGGTYYYAPNSTDLIAIYQKIARVIRNQYILVFNTQKTDGKAHNITIKVNSSGMTGKETRQFTACNIATENTCAAQLTPGLNLQIPIIGYNTASSMSYLWCDLQYEDRHDGNIWFKVTGTGDESTSDFMNCQISTYSPSLGKLHVPNISYESFLTKMSLWADLEYSPTNDGLIWLKVTGYGQN